VLCVCVFDAVCGFCQEMCKVDSSSDSESESNPRCSETSSKVFLIKINLNMKHVSLEHRRSHKQQLNL